MRSWARFAGRKPASSLRPASRQTDGARRPESNFSPGEEIVKQPKTVAFVCLHGSAKSLIAAEHLNGLARARGAALAATTSGPEPDTEVPPHVIEGLREHAVDASHRVPEKVNAKALAQASHIVSFGCDLKTLGLVDERRVVERWDDCPAVIDGFEIAYAFITTRVEQLFDRLTAGQEANIRAG
jgi:arsenate reductase